MLQELLIPIIYSDPEDDGCLFASTTGFIKMENGSVTNVSATELTVDEKLDKIMEAVSFMAQMLATTLITFDKQLQAKESKIIKPL